MSVIAYNRLPPYMQAPARAYIEHGQPPGAFLLAVLRNDLCGAFARADDENLAALQEWTRWLMDIHPGAWGNDLAVEAWIKRGGAGDDGAEAGAGE